METDCIHEIKFVTDNKQAHILTQWLERRCLPDAEFPAGIVSSLYYDTREWKFFYEKINSDFIKTKIRLRWYSDIETGEAGNKSFIEAKFKIGGKREKIRTRTDFSGKWLDGVNLSDQRLSAVPSLLRSSGVCLDESTFPFIVVSYKRRRFVDPVTGARLCIDYDIGVPKVNPLFVPHANPVRLPQAVFEVKGSFFNLPGSLRPLMAMGCVKSSFSKYATCFQTIMRLNF